MSTPIRDEFKVNLLNEAGLGKADHLARAFSTLLNEVESLVPVGRERSVVITKLQEACFFAKRAIATQSENQVDT